MFARNPFRSLALASMLASMGLKAPLPSASAPFYHVGTRQRRFRLNTKQARKGTPRLPPALKGGNYQGKEYLTYAEHDRCKRVAMKLTEGVSKLACPNLSALRESYYQDHRLAIIEDRRG